jgi:hypothetical protein
MWMLRVLLLDQGEDMWLPVAIGPLCGNADLQQRRKTLRRCSLRIEHFGSYGDQTQAGSKNVSICQNRFSKADVLADTALPRRITSEKSGSLADEDDHRQEISLTALATPIISKVSLR